MQDSGCIDFLRAVLPRLQMRWPAFRRVRSQVCKRLRRRLAELGLTSFPAYRTYLEAHPEEWRQLAFLCRVTISRFYRDRAVFNSLRWEILPRLAREARLGRRPRLRCWCAGVASGEEAYTLQLIWRLVWSQEYPGMELEITATHIDPALLARARRARYPASALRELPSCWIGQAFRLQSREYLLQPEFRRSIDWRVQDLTRDRPRGPFDLILCRYLIFTYFVEERQRVLARKLQDRLRPGGIMVLGGSETLPPGVDLQRWNPRLPVYLRPETADEHPGVVDASASSLHVQ